MSINEPTVDEYELVEVTESKPNPYRRALELSALFAALASFVLVLSAIAQTYTVFTLPAAQGATTTQILEYLASILASPLIPLLSFVAIVTAAVVRGVWYEDARSHNKTVVSATVAIVVALITLVGTVYGLISSLINGDSQLGETVQARITAATTDLSAVLISLVTVIVGVIFALSRNGDESVVADADETAPITENTDAADDTVVTTTDK